MEEEYEETISKLNITIENTQKDNDKYIEDLLKQISDLKNSNQDKEIKIKNLNNKRNNRKKPKNIFNKDYQNILMKLKRKFDIE